MGGRPTSSPDAGAPLHDASGAPLSGTGARPRQGAHPATYHHPPGNVISSRALAGAALSEDDVTGAAGSTSNYIASHPAPAYTTQDSASHPLHNNNPWLGGSSIHRRPYLNGENRLDLGDVVNNEQQLNRMISSVSITDTTLTNSLRRFYDRPLPHYGYDRQLGGGGTGIGGGQHDSGTLPLSPDLQRLVEDKHKEALVIFNESLAKHEGVEGGVNKALIPHLTNTIQLIQGLIDLVMSRVQTYRRQQGGGHHQPGECPSQPLFSLSARLKTIAQNLQRSAVLGAPAPRLGGGGARPGPSGGWVGVSVHGAPASQCGGEGVPPSPLNPSQLGLSWGVITGGVDARGGPTQYFCFLEDQLQGLQRTTDG